MGKGVSAKRLQSWGCSPELWTWESQPVRGDFPSWFTVEDVTHLPLFRGSLMEFQQCSQWGIVCVGVGWGEPQVPLS